MQGLKKIYSEEIEKKLRERNRLKVFSILSQKDVYVIVTFLKMLSYIQTYLTDSLLKVCDIYKILYKAETNLSK